MRQLGKVWQKIFGVFAISGVLYFLLTTAVLHLHPILHGPIVIGWGLILCFGLYPVHKKEERQSPPLLDLVFIALTIAITIYTVLCADRYIFNPQEATGPDVVVASLWFALSLIALWRTFGLPIPILLIVVFLYTLYGPYFPGTFAHKGFSFWRIMEQLQTTAVGFWGTLLWILITIVPLFMILSGSIFATVGGEALIDLAKLVAGRVTGGAAQIAVVSSAMEGMISGSAVSNVVGSGSFTIPTMKRLGYRPEFAAAVECVASSAGIVTPPVMGAGAFLMAEILGIPYLKICVAAIIPAAIYYITTAASIHWYAKKIGLGRLPKEEIPDYRKVLHPRKLFPLVLPVAVLVYLMAYERASIEKSCFWAIICSMVIYLFSGWGLKEWWSRIQKICGGFSEAGRSVASIVVLGIVVQIVVSLLGLNAAAVTFTSLLIPAAKTSILLAVALTAFATIILGMGVPVTAAYIIAVSILVPTLAKFGYPLLSIHMFIFYFAMLGAITPPVCAAVYAAMPIAGSKLWPTARDSMIMAISAYITPFIFFFDRRLLMEGDPLSVLIRSAILTIGLVISTIALRGYFHRLITIPERMLLFVAAAAFILWDSSKIPVSVTAVCGLAALVLIFISFKAKGRKEMAKAFVQ